MRQLCTLCSPRWKVYYDSFGGNRLEGKGNPNADILICGESPGNEEAENGKVFVGRSGKMLNDMLSSCGYDKDDVYITNAVKCWNHNITPGPTEIKHCRSYLLHEINTIRPQLIIAVGKTGLTSLGIKEPMKAAAGKLHKSPYTTVPVFSVYHPAYIMRYPELKEQNFEFFRQGIASLGKKVTNGITTGTYHVVRTVCQARKARDFLLKAKVLSFDVETSGLDYYNDKKPLHLKSIAFAFGVGKAIVFPTTTDVFSEEEIPEVMDCIRTVLESDIPKCAHNMKFDVGFLSYVCGINVKHMYMDTILAAYQLDEEKGLSALDVCVARYVPEMAGYDNVMKDKYGSRPDKAFGEDLWYYNAGDADATLRLAKYFFPLLKQEGMWWMHKTILLPAALCFLRMEERGVQCDRELMKILEVKYSEEKRRLIKKMKEVPEVIEFEKRTGKVYNPNSSDHNRKIFIEIYKLPVIKESMKTKLASVGKDELHVYAEEHNNPLAQIVRDIKLIQKSLSTYLTGFYKYLYKDDITHTQFNLIETVTGRTSSGGASDIKIDEFEELKVVDVDPAKRKAPNLQNINKKKKDLRNIIRARKGCYWVGADFSQAELGVAAAIARDEKMIGAYMGGDIHTTVASAAYRIAIEEVTETIRRDAKAISFGCIYGISPVGLAKRMNCTEEKAQEFIDNLFKGFPKLKIMMDNYVRSVDKNGFVISPMGRKRRLERGVNRSYRQAMNFPIQCTTSDLLLLSMIKLYEILDEEGLYGHIVPILAVHDELNLEVEVGYVKKAAELLTRAMTVEIYKDPVVKKVMGDVHIGADLSISPLEGGWGQYQKLTNFTDTDLDFIDSGTHFIDKGGKLDGTLTLTEDSFYDNRVAVFN